MNADSEKKIREFKQSDIRFLILQILSQQTTYMANQELLLFALNEFGNAISHDQLYIELSWLEQTANTIVVRVTGGIYVAQLNDSGLDVAKGNRFIPGIRRPIPSEIP